MPANPAPEPAARRVRRPLRAWLRSALAAMAAMAGAASPPYVADECPFCRWELEDA